MRALLPIAFVNTLIFLGVVAMARLQQLVNATPEIWNLLIQIPIIAAFIWFVLQLAKIQQAQLNAHQMTIDKITEHHEKERIELTQIWMRWADERNKLYMDFLQEERTMRRSSIDTVMTELRRVEELMTKSTICTEDVAEAVQTLSKYIERRMSDEARTTGRGSQTDRSAPGK